MCESAGCGMHSASCPSVAVIKIIVIVHRSSTTQNKFKKSTFIEAMSLVAAGPRAFFK